MSRIGELEVLKFSLIFDVVPTIIYYSRVLNLPLDDALGSLNIEISLVVSGFYCDARDFRNLNISI